MSKVSKKATKKVKVKVTAVLETAFVSYDSTESNEAAMKQIQCFVQEVLEEEEKIPMFVASQAGEETSPVKVTVKIEKVPEKRSKS